jgi:hypothetical protein
MKKACLLIILLLFSKKITAQTTEPDTLKPQVEIQVDSTKIEENQEEDEEENKEEEDSVQLNIFKYRIGMDGNYTSGNVNRFLFRLSSNLDWDIHKAFRFSSSPSFIYGEQSNLLNEREYFADLRASILHERRLYYLAFGSYEKSNLRSILFRWIGAGGIGIKLITKPKVYLSITNVLLFEETNFIELNDRKLWRNSTRLFGEYTLGKKLSVSHTIFFQPALSEKNLRWNGNLIFNYAISTHTSLRSTFENSYESLVVPTRQYNDFRWTFGIAFSGAK